MASGAQAFAIKTNFKPLYFATTPVYNQNFVTLSLEESVHCISCFTSYQVLLQSFSGTCDEM